MQRSNRPPQKRRKLTKIIIASARAHSIWKNFPHRKYVYVLKWNGTRSVARDACQNVSRYSRTGRVRNSNTSRNKTFTRSIHLFLIDLTICSGACRIHIFCAQAKKRKVGSEKKYTQFKKYFSICRQTVNINLSPRAYNSQPTKEKKKK